MKFKIFTLGFLLTAFFFWWLSNFSQPVLAGYCGDRRCDPGEDCVNCWSDCDCPVPPGACSSWIPCGSHGCPGGGPPATTDYSCCPDCTNPVICKDEGTGCGPAKSCTYVSDCHDNPFCPPPNCAQIACVNGQCVSECKADCTPGGPTPTPAPGDKGYIIGRIWNDKNGNGAADEVTQDPHDPNSVQNPANKCGGSYTNVGATIYYSQINGTTTGSVLPQNCNPGPYYITPAIPVGEYLVSVVPPAGWKATTTIKNLTVTKNAYTGQWYGITAQVGCTISCGLPGCETGQINQPVSFSATTTAAGGGDANAEIDSNTSLSITGLTRLSYSNCGNASSTCTTTASFTPTAAGTTYIFCRGYNDALRECRPFNYGAYPADIDCNDGLTGTCTGSGTDCIPFIVTNPRGWLQTAGGDVHGNTDVGTTIPSTLSTYFSSDPAGVVTAGNQFVGSNIRTKMSVPLWQVENSSENLSAFGTRRDTYNYDFFYGRVENIQALPGDPQPGVPQLNNLTTGAYQVVGSLTIGYNFNISSSKQIIIFVPGTLTVKNEISVDTGGFLGFIVRGDIVFDRGLGVNPTANPAGTKLVDGVYVTDGTLRTLAEGQTPDTNKKFIGKGMFAAGVKLDGSGGFDFRRDLGSNNATYPAEYFGYRPDFLVNFPQVFGIRRITWREVAP